MNEARNGSIIKVIVRRHIDRAFVSRVDKLIPLPKGYDPAAALDDELISRLLRGAESSSPFSNSLK
jgi:hypothetical protein